MTIQIEKIGFTEDYVWDISLDGTVVNALGFCVASNTDGINFQLPKQFEYTEDKPYISSGENRNTVKGKAYTELEADVALFNDLYMRGKNGLGIDEVIESSINLSRKNYIDYFDNHEVKLVGNSIKSKKMPPYIKKFLSEAVVLLLENRGRDFLDLYYSYISKLHERKIPITDIVSIGRIKTSLKTYIESTKEFTASGNKKSRQAWYELAIKNKLNVNMGDTIYYVNTGSKVTDSDVQRITIIQDSDGNDVTKQLKKEYNVYKKTILSGKAMKFEKFCEQKGYKAVDELIFNCELIDIDNYNQEETPIEYNVLKYITQFNNRVTPLFVVFNKSVRDSFTEKGKYKNRLIITNPEDRPYLSDEECILTSNQPYEDVDQDDYDVVMIPEDKEVEFWLSVNKKPPYVEECGLDWDSVVSSYLDKKKREEDELYKRTRMEFRNLLYQMDKDDIDEIILGGRLPKKYTEKYRIDPKTKDVYHIETEFIVENIYSIMDEFDNPFEGDTIDESEYEEKF